ncbi:MAG: hypothetical protein ACXWVB_08730, partial [Rhodoplanes sp.]
KHRRTLIAKRIRAGQYVPRPANAVGAGSTPRALSRLQARDLLAALGDGLFALRDLILVDGAGGI